MIEKPLENIPVEPVKLPVHREADNTVSLAAVIPYIPNGRDPRTWEIFVIRADDMPPDAERPYELAKGKRLMQEEDGTWRSIRKWEDITNVPPGRLEKLSGTSFREGIEEQGMRLGNIASAHDAGDYPIDPNEERVRHMRVIPVTLYDTQAWDSPKDIQVAERVRMPLQEFLEKGRSYHARIAEDALGNMREHVYGMAELLELERARLREGGHQGR